MTHHFNVSGQDRKKLVKAITEHLGQEAKYLGVPSCAYQIGTYTVSKDGALSWGDMDDADPAHLDESTELVQALEAAGFHSDEVAFFEEQAAAIEAEETTLSISLPRNRFSDEAIENLKALITAKGRLMKREFQADDLPLTITKEQITFPWFRMGDADEAAAYTTFIQAIGEMAINQKRISPKEKEIVNEKYEFRCFLLRLGMIGDDTKKIRKILMKNLSGSAAFKSGAKKEGEQA